MTYHLISHKLCPYVQRAAIAMAEKQIPFRRTDIDLSAKPGWFLKISPLGKTPVLVSGDTPIFESAAILEYLEDTGPNPLHPADSLIRARHRGWIEFSSATLNDIAGLYNAPDAETFGTKSQSLKSKFARLEDALAAGPWFAGETFSLVDTSFAPVFRYFDTLDRYLTTETFAFGPKVTAWRQALGARPSVINAVSSDYAANLEAFLLKRSSYLARLIARANARAVPA